MIAGRYSLEEQIGVGGMATVWRATDHVLDRQLAIKKLSAPLASDPAAAERFRREAQAAARLQHPGILVVHDAGDDDEGPWIAMELIQGETLATRLARQGSLAMPEVLAIAEQVAAALDHAHQNGVIHRDVKPANLVIERGGRVRLTDFGIAKAVDDPTAITSTGEVVGTISYMAPEVLAGQPASTRSDVYSLGAVVHEMIAGRKPFGGDTPAELMAAIGFAEPEPLPGEIDQAVVEAVRRAMDRDPDRRPFSASEFAQSLIADATLAFSPSALASHQARVDADREAPTVVVPSVTTGPNPSQAAEARPAPPARGPLPASMTGMLLLLITALVGVLILSLWPDNEDPPAQAAPARPSTTTPTTQPTTIPTTAIAPTTTPPTTTPTTTLPSTTVVDEPLLIASEIFDLLDSMEPPTFRARDVRVVEDEVRRSIERWEEQDFEQTAEHLQRALESTERLPATEARRDLVELLVELAEAMGFEVERED